MSDGRLSLYAIAPTIFSADGATVDAAAVADNAARLSDSGISDLLLTGSYGEFQSLTDDERIEVLRAVRAAGCARSIMACAALPSVAPTAALGRRMLDAGADMVMVSAPLVAEVDDGDILRHFEELDRRIGGPLVIYNNPVFGVDLSPTLLGTVAALPHVVGIKQGTRSLPGLVESISEVRRASAGKVRVFAASDITAHVSLTSGVDGLTSTNSWVFPSVFGAMVAMAENDDYRLLRACADALRPYLRIVQQFGQPRVVKAAMQLRGYRGSRAVRLPYVALGPEENRALQRALDDADEMIQSLPFSHLAVAR